MRKMIRVAAAAVLALATAGAQAACNGYSPCYDNGGGYNSNLGTLGGSSLSGGSMGSMGGGYENSESHSVRGYTRSNGTYVQPYEATNPNSSRDDNYSTRGNINPYTGRRGTVNPYR